MKVLSLVTWHRLPGIGPRLLEVAYDVIMDNEWRKSTRSIANGDCAEIGQAGCVIGVRDTKEAERLDRVVLEFPRAAWEAFTGKLKA